MIGGAPGVSDIVGTPALQDREQTKVAALADVLAIASKARGATDLQALLAARTGMAAVALATTAWLDDSSLALGERVHLAFGELKSLLVSADAEATGRTPAKRSTIALSSVA
jgi:hypothetical protein